jgi:hypothetical protein
MSEVSNEISTGMGELAVFHRFIGDRLKEGQINLSPEEVLDLWRDEHPDSEDFADTVEALREAIEDLEAGAQTRPFEEFDRVFRAQHNIPVDP